jgi:hypothetical protein
MHRVTHVALNIISPPLVTGIVASLQRFRLIHFKQGKKEGVLPFELNAQHFALHVVLSFALVIVVTMFLIHGIFQTRH